MLVSRYDPTFSYLGQTAIWLGISDADTEGWYYWTAGLGTSSLQEVRQQGVLGYTRVGSQVVQGREGRGWHGTLDDCTQGDSWARRAGA